MVPMLTRILVSVRIDYYVWYDADRFVVCVIYFDMCVSRLCMDMVISFVFYV